MLSYATITKEMFNSPSRQIAARALIYFDETPITITRADYMVSLEIDEACMNETDSLDGTVIANILSLKLSSTDKRFNQANTSGPYYGKIKEGVKIKVEIQPVGVADWIAMGTYYITNWLSDGTGYNTTVTAMDLVNQLSTKSMDYLSVIKYTTVPAYLTVIMSALGITDYTVALSRTIELECGYPSDSKFTGTMNALMAASLAYFTISRTERPVMKSLVNTDSLVQTFTDADQIVSVSTSQTITKTYDGCALTLMQPSPEIGATLLSINDLTIEAGATISKTYNFSNTPVRKVDSIGVYNNNNDIVLDASKIGNRNMAISITNSSDEEESVTIEVIGEYINLPTVEHLDNPEGKLSVTRDFIQYDQDANWYTDTLDAFITSDCKYITVVAKGNPLLELGDKIRINSSRYAVDKVGTIIKAKYSYTGSLSATYVLLNTAALEGVVNG